MTLFDLLLLRLKMKTNMFIGLIDERQTVIRKCTCRDFPAQNYREKSQPLVQDHNTISQCWVRSQILPHVSLGRTEEL